MSNITGNSIASLFGQLCRWCLLVLPIALVGCKGASERSEIELGKDSYYEELKHISIGCF